MISALAVPFSPFIPPASRSFPGTFQDACKMEFYYDFCVGMVIRILYHTLHTFSSRIFQNKKAGKTRCNCLQPVKRLLTGLSSRGIKTRTAGGKFDRYCFAPIFFAG
jgi:hypothetical protein